MSVTLTNAEKQARYRERHLGVDGEKVRVGLTLNASTRAKMGRLARYRGYTITTVVEELVERAERRVTAMLPSRALATPTAIIRRASVHRNHPPLRTPAARSQLSGLHAAVPAPIVSMRKWEVVAPS
jgi:hypothetical protein